ncbi:MAG: ATP-binding protein, partial [Prochlorococcaceae cyanobacterium]
MTTNTQGWLAISTEGFAAMNAARPPEHLVKELVQNSLDSFADGQSGEIRLRFSHRGDHVQVDCQDNGSGIDSLADLRVVYLTHKTDSHLKRGRFGRGFKEALCIAEQALVVSGSQQLEFLRENNERISRQSTPLEPLAGTRVSMRMPWGAETCEQLDRYFERFLVPDGIVLEVNGVRIAPRSIEHRIAASLITEVYDPSSQSWKKPSRRTTIYQMGIPVAALDWSVPFHCDIQQRVPMNPNRDAVASGYPLKLHVACLPSLLDGMEQATVKDDWVGAAARRCDGEVQKRIIERAFGTNIARSVPRVGPRHFDEDARDLGVQVINTAQASGGFREILKLHVPSALEVVRRDEGSKAAEASSNAFTIAEAMVASDGRRQWIEQQGGVRHV